MKTTFLRLFRLLALLGITIGLNGCKAAEDIHSESLLTITAQIGDTWDEVTQNSTYKVGPLYFGGIGTIIDKPHIFVYSDPNHHMVLDHVSYTKVSVELDAPHRIDNVSIGTYKQSMEVDETWLQLQSIIYKMEQAGWIPNDDSNKRNPGVKSAADLRTFYLSLPGGARGAEKVWYDDYGNEAWVSLVKAITGNESGEEPRFNIVLQIQVATFPKTPKAKK